MLDLAHVEPTLRGAAKLWLADNIDIYENDILLPHPIVDQTLVSLQSDKSFASYEAAFAHLKGPRLPNDTQVYWEQTFVDIMFEYPIQSDRSSFSIHTGFNELALRVVTNLQFVSPNGARRSYEFLDDPGLIRIDPSWYESSVRFFKAGFAHFFTADYFLLLLCIVVPFRRWRELLLIVISITLAQTITLIASAYQLAPESLWFQPLIETLIAVSIVYLALENIVGKTTLQRRTMLAFTAGLALGFNYFFAFANTLQFAGSHKLDSVLSFNAGVELGQILAIALLLLGLELLFRRVVAERMGTIILSGLVIQTAWRSMLDRGGRLRQYQFEWPTLTAASAASAMRGLMVVMILASLVWLVFGLLGSWLKSNPGDNSTQLPQHRD
jgi:hypothetical protein